MRGRARVGWWPWPAALHRSTVGGLTDAERQPAHEDTILASLDRAS